MAINTFISLTRISNLSLVQNKLESTTNDIGMNNIETIDKALILIRNRSGPNIDTVGFYTMVFELVIHNHCIQQIDIDLTYNLRTIPGQSSWYYNYKVYLIRSHDQWCQTLFWKPRKLPIAHSPFSPRTFLYFQAWLTEPYMSCGCF